MKRFIIALLLLLTIFQPQPDADAGYSRSSFRSSSFRSSPRSYSSGSGLRGYGRPTRSFRVARRPAPQEKHGF